MLSDLRTRLSDVNPANGELFFIRLKGWHLSVNAIIVRHYMNDELLEALFATLCLSNLILSLDVKSLASIVKGRWPNNMPRHLMSIDRELAKAESSLRDLLILLEDSENLGHYALKYDIECMLK